MKRCSGVLLPIFSLPSPYGIGTLGKAAYDWIDFLHEAGQQLWQVLPIGPTSFGDSPYQSFSAFAGNPYFIDLEQLCEDGLLQKEDCAPLADQADSAAIDYAKQYQYRYAILKKAYSRFDNPNEISRFRKAHNWVDDYALFMALKDISDQAHLELTDRVDRWTASRWISWCKKFIDEVKGYHRIRLGTEPPQLFK